MAIRLHHKNKKEVARLVLSDTGKAFAGSIVAIGLAVVLPFIAALIYRS